MAPKRIRLTYRVTASFVVMVGGITAMIFGRFLGNSLFFYPGIALLVLGGLAFALFMAQRAAIRYRKYGRRRSASPAKPSNADH
ncbi:MAG: hypothetical protein HQ559_03430 [Lentisphaerae bacterium]|nr:hypothetical protein [Lentisphaerota bacterium]